jgi:hypothetical protein
MGIEPAFATLNIGNRFGDTFPLPRADRAHAAETDALLAAPEIDGVIALDAEDFLHLQT